MEKKYTITNSKDQDVRAFPEGSRTYKVEADGGEDMQVSDGYHTMDELYEHRIILFIALCRHMHELLGIENPGKFAIWRSKKHSDGELCFGTGTQFILGIGKEKGKQISYHLPVEMWNETDFAETLEIAPEWDGHSSADVLERLKKI